MIDALTWFDSMALLAVIVIGLPHGAFDGAVYALLANHSSDRITAGTRHTLPVFLALYSLLALAIILLWLIFPILSLMGFLVLSGFHFGKGDTDGYHGFARIIALIAHGGLVTILLPLIHKDAAFAIFTALTFQPASGLWLLSYLITGASLLWGLACLVYGYFAVVNAHYRARFFEVCLAALVMAWLPLLPAFAFYFCVIHSRRHFLLLYQTTASLAPRSVLPLGLGLSCASWGAGLGMLFVISHYQSIALSALQIVFIGLAALTVPHMILIDGFWRPLSKSPTD